jgi:hypothetical protein
MIGDLAADIVGRDGRMTRKTIVGAAMSVGLALALWAGGPAAGAAQAQQAGAPAAMAAAPTELSAQRRPPRRLRIYPRYYAPDGVVPRYNPGPNAVRDCTATYVQEYRPSGTVSVPRMNCFWRRG